MSRPVLAFLIAPLWVPLLFAPLMAASINGSWGFSTLLLTLVSALFAYVATLVFAVPAYFLLRSFDPISVWLALSIGFIAGLLTGIIFAYGFARSLGNPAPNLLAGLDMGALILMAPGAVGALVGITLWAIARPRPG